MFAPSAIVVGAKGGSYMNNSCSVDGGDKIAGDDAEGAFIRPHPVDKLLVINVFKISTLVFPGNGVLQFFVGSEDHGNQILCQYHCDGLRGVWIGGADTHVGNICSHGKSGVRRQCPWCGGPGHDLHAVSAGTREEKLRFLIADQAEEGDAGCVPDVLVASRHVELVRAEAGAGGGRVGLDGIALVEQLLVIELFEQPPDCLDIPVVIGDVGVVHIDPEPHVAGQVFPYIGKLHHILATGLVVIFNGNLCSDVFLGYPESLLHAQFNRQSVGIPAGLAFDLITLQCTETADGILDGARHDMVDAGHPVG